ncbi:MAG: hypothetical protein U1F67_17770 [Rubrivivax sp.]
MNHTAWRVAVIGAGPVGLALALHGARVLPEASFTVYDARPAERDVSADPRTLALALGSVMFLERLACWPAAAAAPITSVHVSQAPPSPGQPEVLIEAGDGAEALAVFAWRCCTPTSALGAAWPGRNRARCGQAQRRTADRRHRRRRRPRACLRLDLASGRRPAAIFGLARRIACARRRRRKGEGLARLPADEWSADVVEGGSGAQRHHRRSRPRRALPRQGPAALYPAGCG